MPDIGFHPLIDRHTPESRFTHWTISREEILQRVLENWEGRQPSYRDGVVQVPVDPHGFFSPVVVLQPGDRLRGIYEVRHGDEPPRKSVVADRDGRKKTPAVGVDVILYHRDVLAEDGEHFDHEWAVISINARITKEPEPMTVGTLMANHFHIAGGTSTNMTPEEFETALRKSYLYWIDKAKMG